MDISKTIKKLLLQNLDRFEKEQTGRKKATIYYLIFRGFRIVTSEPLAKTTLCGASDR